VTGCGDGGGVYRVVDNGAASDIGLCISMVLFGIV